MAQVASLKLRHITPQWLFAMVDRRPSSPRSPRPRAALIMIRANGDTIYVNDTLAASSFLAALGSETVAAPRDEFTTRSQLVLSALSAQDGLNTLNGMPNHNLGTTTVSASGVLSKSVATARRSRRARRIFTDPHDASTSTTSCIPAPPIAHGFVVYDLNYDLVDSECQIDN